MSPTRRTTPLVSCIMPTFDRPAFVRPAALAFLAQDHPRTELIVVDDSTSSIRDLLPDDGRIRYIRLRARASVGRKRNLACAAARGDLIAHWDDDDWYPTWRISRQVESLGREGTLLSGSSRLHFWDAASRRAWRYEHRGGSGWVAGSTMAYRRDVCERHPFPDVSIGEDTALLDTLDASAVDDLRDPSLCVASIHDANVSPKSPAGWCWRPASPTAVRRLVGDDPRFGMAGRESAPASHDRPLVSCVMPTADRRAFVALAIERFLESDYPNRELVIVDDGRDAVGDLATRDARIRYVRLTKRHSIGRKRNLACEAATGEIIAHWDDDDWYAPARLRYQVLPILEGRADATGLVCDRLLTLPDGVVWAPTRTLHRRMFVGDVHGGTIVVHRDVLRRGVRYPDVDLAEDAGFLRAAIELGVRIERLENRDQFVYVRHGTNAWSFAPGTFLDPRGWRAVAGTGAIPATDLDALREAALATPMPRRRTLAVQNAGSATA